jgi:lysophospholipase L1-like esterase
VKRREFLGSTTGTLTAAAASLTAEASLQARQAESGRKVAPEPAPGFTKAADLWKEPFKRLVIMGESTVEGGPWLLRREDRFADVLAGLITACQKQPIEYYNKGIGANAISPRSPGYAESRKPSALERYKSDVIDLKPDLFVLCYGLNDMRAGMRVEEFRQDLATIIRDVKQACAPLIVLTTVYYTTGWKSWPPYDKGSVGLTLEYNACIRGLAGEFGCVVADAWGAEGGADWLIHYDGVHANKVGNLVLAHRVFEALAQHASGLSQWTFTQDRDSDWSRMATRRRAEAGYPFQKTW